MFLEKSSLLCLSQRESCLVPELVWAGELRVCDHSTVNSSESCRADLGSQPVAVSWAAVAVGWRSDSQGCAHHHSTTTPTSPVPCPDLIPVRTSIHHVHIIMSQVATCSHTFTWESSTVWKRWLFKHCGEWLGHKLWAPACLLLQWSDSYLASSFNVGLWQQWQPVLVSRMDVGHQCLGMMRNLWLMI